jgi:phosphoribosylpyrophosphate synthetase
MSKIHEKTVVVHGIGWDIEIDRFSDGDTMIEYNRDKTNEQVYIVLSQLERRALREALGD